MKISKLFQLAVAVVLCVLLGIAALVQALINASFLGALMFGSIWFISLGFVAGAWQELKEEEL